MTNVPSPTFGPTGFQAPTESDILTGVQADINAAFGGGLNPSLSTPQGQLASSIAAIIGNVNDTFIGLSNQFDPAFSTGRYQDAIARIYFLRRNPALPTVLNVNASGLPGVTIPANTQITDQTGNVYVATANGTIDATGNAAMQFANLAAGPIAIPSSVSIFQAIPGWDSVTITSGVLGQNVETRSAFETRRQNAVAANSVGSVASIRGAVLQVAGVTDCYVTENASNGTATIGGVVLIPNSVFVAVTGGSASDVARAIWTRKIPGCSYNGNTTVVVLDQNSGYSPPFPSYNVTFNRPDPLPIFFSVTLVSTTLIPANATTLIQNALINAFAGGDGGPRAQIGGLLLASRFASSIVSLGTWAQIRSLFIASPNNATASIVGSISGSTLTVTSVSAGTLAAGQVVSGSGLGGTGTVLPGTTIVSQLSGTVGGTGTYQVTNSQMTLSGTLTSTAITPTQTQVNINQSPFLVAPNIFVTAV